MLLPHSIPNRILESLGLISGYSHSPDFLQKSFIGMLPVIVKSSAELKNQIRHLTNLPPQEAGQQMDQLIPLMSLVSNLQKEILQLEDNSYGDAKKNILDYLADIQLYFLKLQEKAQASDSYKLSEAILAEDWNRVEDAHWDNY
jgi:hypothetical protein